jgi:hypothetical protein
MTDDTITCPYCKSDQWKCYDQQTELFEDRNVSQDDKNRYFEMPVGYMNVWIVARHTYTGTTCPTLCGSVVGMTGMMINKPM